MERRVDFFTRYDAAGASSRYRFYSYAAYLREIGWEVRLEPFFPAGYLARLYRGGGKSKLAAARALGRRLLQALVTKNPAVIEYELLPFLPYGLEKVFLRNRRYVLNFDDNVWEKYRRIGWLHDKFDCLVSGSAGVIVANEFLRERVAPLHTRVIKIPTVVDLNLYPVGLEKFREFTVVWIGSPATYPYLQQASEALRAMARQVAFELLIIGGRQLAARPVEGVKCRYVDWSAATEGELLARSHVGIMPLRDEPFARGKSAFKLIQYQAAGLPSIASDVGENRQVVQHGWNGFLVSAPEEWAAALRTLATEPAVYEAQHRAALGRRREFSLEKYQPVYRRFLEETLWP